MDDAVLSSRPIYQGWFDLVNLRMRLGGKELDRALLLHPSGAAVLAYDPQRRVAMTIRETRAGPLHEGVAPMPEAIAGVVEAGDLPVDGARREAMEEAGLMLREIEPVGHVWMTPSSTTERVHLFLAAYSSADRVHEGGGLAEEHEHIETREEPLADLWSAIEQGVLSDAKTVMLLQALMIRHPELFEPR